MADMLIQIERYWQELATAAGAIPLDLLERAASLLLDCHGRGGTIFIAGNGGSAATASHFACDLAKGTQVPDRPPFRVIPLTDNVPLLTAWANDVSYEGVFAQQFATLARPGDLAVLISASGDSPNVLAVAKEARQCGAGVIALTGRSGGRLGRLVESMSQPGTVWELTSDGAELRETRPGKARLQNGKVPATCWLTIRVPADQIEQVEDAHLAIAHSLCVALRQQLKQESSHLPDRLAMTSRKKASRRSA
jgi:D-sedoheptulose 7-phosphate isomerase